MFHPQFWPLRHHGPFTIQDAAGTNGKSTDLLTSSTYAGKNSADQGIEYQEVSHNWEMLKTNNSVPDLACVTCSFWSPCFLFFLCCSPTLPLSRKHWHARASKWDERSGASTSLGNMSGIQKWWMKVNANKCVASPLSQECASARSLVFGSSAPKHARTTPCGTAWSALPAEARGWATPVLGAEQGSPFHQSTHEKKAAWIFPCNRTHKMAGLYIVAFYFKKSFDRFDPYFANKKRMLLTLSDIQPMTSHFLI